MKTLILRFVLAFMLLALEACKTTDLKDQNKEVSIPSAPPTFPSAPPIFPSAPPTFIFIPENGEELCESSFSATIKSGLVSYPLRTLINKIYEKNIWDLDPNVMMIPHIESLEATEVHTLLCIRENRTPEITYPDERIGYKVDWNVRLVLYPSGDTVGSNTFEGNPPPDLEKYNDMKDYLPEGGVYGDPPAGSLLEWLYPFFDGLKIYSNIVPVRTIALSPVGNTVAVGGDSTIVTMWNYQTGDISSRISLIKYVTFVPALAFSPDGKTLALPGVAIELNEPIQLWDVTTNHLLRAFYTKGFLMDVEAMTFSSDGSLLVTGSFDGTIYLWNVAYGKIVKTLKLHSKSVNSISESPNSPSYVSGSDDGSVILWDAVSGQIIHSLEGHTDSVKSVAFSPDGSMIASGSMDNSVILWDAATGQQLYRIRSDDDYVSSIAFSPDGKILAFADPVVIRLWNIEKKEIVATLEGHHQPVTGLVFTPDGKKIISGSDDITVRIWDLQE